ncbi:hypothetical protein [Methylobacterium iners]|uniref:Uncharacterized protein n=1 Tax=Methylobacterium iners TaxID=418707 RepID=A0ABQ4S5R0_9HYPH|nr:hypothetical protein [Methylobacterium iners]GJD97214.1 hypothetical protein OCOJLMKI_4442 [Methylobacterium iners]
MSTRLISLSTAAALAFAALGTASVRADEPAVVYAAKIVGAKTIGAMTLETLGRATNGAQVQRQGGFAVAGAVQWIRTPVVQVTASAQAF